jgi:hypothetical protein
MKVLLDNENVEKKVEFNDLFYKEVISIFLNFLQTEEDIDLQTVPMEQFSRA